MNHPGRAGFKPDATALCCPARSIGDDAPQLTPWRGRPAAARNGTHASHCCRALECFRMAERLANGPLRLEGQPLPTIEGIAAPRRTFPCPYGDTPEAATR